MNRRPSGYEPQYTHQILDIKKHALSVSFHSYLFQWLREPDLNRRPSGYEPDELPDCSIPRLKFVCFLKLPTLQLGFQLKNWLREPDLNRRPSGYEPDELPDCSIPRLYILSLSTTLFYLLS